MTNNDKFVTVEILKAAMSVTRKDMEELTESIFESIQIVLETNKHMAQSMDARLSVIEEYIKQQEASTRVQPSTAVGAPGTPGDN
jgi:hypothetical protein